MDTNLTSYKFVNIFHSGTDYRVSCGARGQHARDWKKDARSCLIARPRVELTELSWRPKENMFGSGSYRSYQPNEGKESSTRG